MFYSLCNASYNWKRNSWKEIIIINMSCLYNDNDILFSTVRNVHCLILCDLIIGGNFNKVVK